MVAPLVLLALVGCMTTPPPRSAPAPAAAARSVDGGVRSAYFRTDPQCVLVQAADPAIRQPMHAQVEAALARQLSSRFARIVSPDEHRHVARDLALDTAEAEDVRRAARQAACPAILYWTLVANDHEQTPLWSRRTLSIDAGLRRTDDDAELWRDRHLVKRASGDPPLSLFSLPLAAYKAARFDRSPELAASMGDDLARGLFMSLPDLQPAGRQATRTQ